MAGTTCLQNAANMAHSFCDIATRHVENTVTSWGCAISDLLMGTCSAVEEDWSSPSIWGYSCANFQCSGQGITNCESTWRMSQAYSPCSSGCGRGIGSRWA